MSAPPLIVARVPPVVTQRLREGLVKGSDGGRAMRWRQLDNDPRSSKQQCGGSPGLGALWTVVMSSLAVCLDHQVGHAVRASASAATAAATRFWDTVSAAARLVV